MTVSASDWIIFYDRGYVVLQCVPYPVVELIYETFAEHFQA